MRIHVLGICQAEVLEQCLSAMLPDAKVSATFVSDPATFDFAAIADPTSIFFLHSTHQETIASSGIMKKSNVHYCPNMFFPAYHPDLVYARTDQAYLKSPMKDYNSSIVLYAWLHKLSVARTMELFCEPVYERLGFYSYWDQSWRYLRGEFERVGLPFENEMPRLAAAGCFMHSTNHPKLQVVAAVARLLLDKLGIAPVTRTPEAFLHDTLADASVWPVYPEIGRRLGIDGDYAFKQSNDLVKGGRISVLSLERFIAASFEKYDAVAKRADVSCDRLLTEETRYRDLETLATWAPRAARRNPYSDLPNHCFWRKAVAGVPMLEVDPVIAAKFTLSEREPVSTAGSCFAQHIARTLVAEGYNYFVAEPAPAGMAPELAADHGFGMFSARYGNVYTMRQMVQLLDRAYGRFTPVDAAWRRPDGRYVDAFRPQIEPDGYDTPQAVDVARDGHFAAVRRMAEQTGVFIFTLGLTEAWRAKADGAVFPLAPGVVAGVADPGKYEFVNFNVAEVEADIDAFVARLRAVNPAIRIIFTVSPVPLIATYEPRHVLVSTTYSKAVLRAAVERVVGGDHGVDYFPSFEIITGHFNRGSYFEDDLRSIRPEGVAHVMRLFTQHFFEGSSTDTDAMLRREIAVDSRIICDEEALDAVSQVFLPAVPAPPGPLELEGRLKIERAPAIEPLLRVLGHPRSLVAEVQAESAALRTEVAREREQVARLGQELDIRGKLVAEVQAEAVAFRMEATRLDAELVNIREAAELSAQGLRSEVSFLTRQLDEFRTSGWWAIGTRLVRIRARVAPRGRRRAAAARLTAFLGSWGTEGTRGVVRRAVAGLKRLRSKRPAGGEAAPADGAPATALVGPAQDGPAARRDPQIHAARPTEATGGGPPGGAQPLELIKLEGVPMSSFASALSFAASLEPVVSVVVPVLNKIEYTLCCLASMCRTVQATAYEVIVVDDGSSDATADLLSKVPNLRYLRNPTTLGFVRSVNRGASAARGRYVLFLNNDTQAQERWLDSLVQAFDADPLVGIAGSKLIYPSGHLQEAGTVVRSDGTVELVGLNDDPSKPEYNRPRQVDHCSGASLMISRDLFVELGGFDEIYAPAYFEDCDLSLKVRQSGRKVVYAPESVVVHHLSVTTADAGDDFKRIQIEKNRRKLLERWRPVLAEQERVRAIAFYLPQFHPIPENDAWWGKGFTEWTYVARAKPVFQGHLQPRLPADLGFYDLRLPEVRSLQAELAASHGLHGFCYYYYWFNGKRLLGRPLTDVLTSGKPDFPFCLCWANENWTRRWDGCETDVLIAQHHSPKDDRSFIESLLPYFVDRRYIRIDGRPLLLIYRAELLPDARSTIARWREVYRVAGGGQLYLGAVQNFEGHSSGDPRRVGFDAAVEFPPHGLAVGTGPPAEMLVEGFHGRFYDYARTSANFGQRALPSYPLFRTVMPSWDNTPRGHLKGHIFADSSPALYERWLRRVVDQTRQLRFGDERTVFINAWNEWGEGNYLEPDEQYGHAYLEATRRALGGEDPREEGLTVPGLTVPTAADRPA